MRALFWFFLGAASGSAAGWALTTLKAKRWARERARFLSFAAHEINSPVASLNMTALNFVHGIFGPVPKEHRQWLVLIREQAARLNALVGDLRDFLHSEFHHDLRLHREKVPLTELIPACLDGMRESLARSGAALELRVPQVLPEVAADLERLSRVFTAVFHHARKFRTAGPIVVSAEAEPVGVAVTVEYQGLKVSAQQAAHALDLFFPVHHPHTQVLASVGLGLGIGCRIVEAHGGTMTLNVDDQGRCRIVIRLPHYVEALRQEYEKKGQDSSR